MGGVGKEGPLPAAGPLLPGGDDAAAKKSKDVDEEGGDGSGGSAGAGGGKGLRKASAYDSEEERMAALAPQTEGEALMKERKMKADKMIAKKTSTSLNPRKVLTTSTVFARVHISSPSIMPVE